MVTRRKFIWKFKLKAVKLVTQREVSMPQRPSLTIQVPQGIATKGTIGLQ